MRLKVFRGFVVDFEVFCRKLQLISCRQVFYYGGLENFLGGVVYVL